MTNNIKLIASNPNKRNYSILENLEAGLVLTGTEIKSLRTQTPNIRDAFVEIYPKGSSFEAFLLNSHIPPYAHGNIWNHDPLRKRKLLLHKRELQKLYGAIIQKGLSLIPLRAYFLRGRAKIELGLGKGLKKYDKRETLKKKAVQREIRSSY